MFTITSKQILSSEVKRIDIKAPIIARRVRPGQFVSVCCEEDEERVPLAVVEADDIKGTIALIIQEVGPATKKLGNIAIGENVFSIVGPLGIPARIEKRGAVFCASTGLGTAQILPICRAFQRAGSKVIGVIGARSRKQLILEAQMRLACSKIFIATDDGSYERRGLATDVLRELIAQQRMNRVDPKSLLIYAIGSVEMMQAASALAKEAEIDMRVQVNPVMVDCMGMCGSCRVRINGKMKLACIDGPEFDGHAVDFQDLHIRMKAFEGLNQWDNPSSQFSREKNGSTILGRFLSGIRKN